MKAEINTRRGKQQFIRTLMNSLRNEILAKVPHMPAEWDGHEIREYIAEHTQRERTNLMKTNTRRQRDYRNAIAVTSNL